MHASQRQDVARLYARPQSRIAWGSPDEQGIELKRACDGVHQAVSAHHGQASRKTPRRLHEHSAGFKKERVGRSLEPGESVAAIAMEGGMYANLLFGWRRTHLNGVAQGGGAAPHQPPRCCYPANRSRPSTPNT